MKKVISLRMDSTELAKARDGLIAKGIDTSKLDSMSQIIRLTFYYGLLALCDDPKSSPTFESIEFIHTKMNPTTVNKAVTLEDLINKG